MQIRSRTWTYRILLLLLLFFIGFASFLLYVKYSLKAKALNLKAPGYVILIPPGMSTQKIATQLSQEGILKHPDWFVWWAYLTRARLHFKAGEYLIKPGMSAQDAMDLFVSGKVIQHAITIVEGWTFERLLATLNQTPQITQTLQNLPRSEMMEKIGLMELQPEGLFFPDTYYFPAGTTDVAFLKRAYKILNKKLMQAWERRDRNQTALQSPYEALILASIIEKESGFCTEYGDIAGVYHRRLKRNMPLQADPTLVYGAGERYAGHITRDMLKKPGPYNTYINPGLPPTPIAMPSEKAIIAALNPKPGDSLYFVAKANGKGHVFSKTLDEHNTAVAQYRKWLAGQIKSDARLEANQEASKAVGNKDASKKISQETSTIEKRESKSISTGRIDPSGPCVEAVKTP